MRMLIKFKIAELAEALNLNFHTGIHLLCAVA